MGRAIKDKWSWPVAAVLMAAAIIRLPVADAFGASMRMSLTMLFHVAAIGLLAAYVYSTANKWAGIFLVWALISVFVPSLIMSGGKVLCSGFSQNAIVELIAGILIYTIIIQKCSNTERLLDVMCVVVFIHVAILIMNIGKAKSIGLMTNANEASAFIAVCFPAFLRKYWWYALPVPLIGLFLSKSLVGFLGCGLASIFFIGITTGQKFWPAAIMLTLVIIYHCKGLFAYGVDTVIYKLMNNQSYVVRWDAWQRALDLHWMNYWVLVLDERTGFLVKKFNGLSIFGFGIGNWKIVYSKMYEKGQLFPFGWTNIHSDYIEGLMEMGWGYVACLIGYISNVCRRFYATIDKKQLAVSVAILAAIAGCMVPNTFFKMNSINVMFAVVGLATLEIKLKKSVEIVQ